MKSRWAYIWEYTDLESGERRRTYVPVTAAEFQPLTGQFLDESDARAIEETKVDRNVVGYVNPDRRRTPKMPEFNMLNDSELRELWRAHRDPDVRRLILEVVHGRRVMKEIAGFVSTIRKEYGDGLVAMNQLRCLVQDEVRRS
ncbi:hypothetical protein [Burkholderia pyrrocinia]|uniref:hypothetical protein n=1 Tax=Burkholderia pyrrocinia TaxID=60550 RepID=UPI00158EB8A5|nr:hypothetical protein [Burkholderia pyrrocinia]